MAQQPDSALQSFLRLCVMIAAVVVAWLGYQAYGPPIEELDELADQAMQTASAWLEPSDDGMAKSPPSAVTTVAPRPLGELQPLSDLRPAPSTEMVPLRPAPAELPPLRGRGLLAGAATPQGVEPMVQQLRGMGAESFHLAAWGADGGLQRFECQAPVPGGSGFVRHFDAIEPSAELAVAKVYQDVRHWRNQLASVSN